MLDAELADAQTDLMAKRCQEWLNAQRRDSPPEKKARRARPTTSTANIANIATASTAVATTIAIAIAIAIEA
jgi:hypothetical protein